MKLTIKRKLLAVGNFSEWEERDYEVVVWEWKDNRETIRKIELPKGYALGLLSTYIEGFQVTLPSFDEELEKIGMTRERILEKLK